MKKLSLVLGTLLILGSSLSACSPREYECSYEEATIIYNSYQNNMNTVLNNIKTIIFTYDTFYKSDNSTDEGRFEADITTDNYYYFSYSRDTKNIERTEFLVKSGDVYVNQSGDKKTAEEAKKYVENSLSGAVFLINLLSYPSEKDKEYYNFYRLSDGGLKIEQKDNEYYRIFNSDGLCTKCYSSDSDKILNLEMQYNPKLNKRSA